MKRTIQLTDEQKKVYDQMKKLALAELNGKMITTVNVITQLMRLQQITCGHFTADDGTFQDVASNRLPELMDVLEEVEGKVVSKVMVEGKDFFDGDSKLGLNPFLNEIFAW